MGCTAVCIDMRFRHCKGLMIVSAFCFSMRLFQSESFAQWSSGTCWNVREITKFVTYCPDHTNLVHGTYRILVLASFILFSAPTWHHCHHHCLADVSRCTQLNQYSVLRNNGMVYANLESACLNVMILSCDASYLLTVMAQLPPP
jgi:hypothetical protein